MRAPSDNPTRRMFLAVPLAYRAARVSGLAGGEARGEASEARPADVAGPAPTHPDPGVRPDRTRPCNGPHDCRYRRGCRWPSSCTAGRGVDAVELDAR
jgi:hypothetical protein